MIKKFLLIAILLLPFSVFAAGDTPNIDSFTQFKTLSATFEQENYYPGLEPFIVNGTVNIVNGAQAIWEYTSPNEYYYLTPEGIEHYSEELNQLLKIKVDTTDVTDPSAVLLSIFLDTSSIKSNFDITESGNTATLLPKTIATIKDIKIDFESGVIKQITTEDNGGNIIKITFNKVTMDGEISAETFIKVLLSGVRIVEG